jgi:hypothetical protein
MARFRRRFVKVAPIAQTLCARRVNATERVLELVSLTSGIRQYFGVVNRRLCR